MKNKPVSLTAILDDQKRVAARQLRASLFQRCRAAADQMEDDIAGFAIVVWDGEGNMRTAYDAERGPIRATLVPTLVSDALNRHVAVMISAAREAENE